MERRIIYGGEIPSTLDLLYAQTYSMVSSGQLAQDVLQSAFNPGSGTNPTLAAGFAPTYPGGLTINFAAGRVYSLVAVDSAIISDLPADARTFLMQGQYDASFLTFGAAPGVGGQSRIDLVQAAVTQVDDQNTVLMYYNTANPASPLSGPANSGAAQPTRRWFKVTLTVKAGTASATPTAPTADAGNIPLFLMTIANGQAAINGSNLAVHTSAPFIAGLTTQHHTGAAGGAPKIVLTTEVQGTLPVANGGTGATTAQTAQNAMSPMTTLGDTQYHNGTNVVRLAPPTAAKTFYLQQTGTGAAGAAPVWNSALPIANTTGGSTPTDYMGSSAGNSVYMDATSGPVVVSTGDVTVILDSDNNSTTNALVIKKNAGNTGATLVATVNEDGNFSGQAAFIDDFGQNPQTTAGLTYGYFGGNISKGSTNIRAVSNGTVALTASTTNYVEVDPVTGIVSKNVVGFTAGSVPMATIVAGAASITSVTDSRDLMGTSDVPIGQIVNAFAYNANSTAGLNFAYYAGQYLTPSNAAGNIVGGTIALTASTTNYVELDPTAGAIVKNVVGFTMGRIPLFQVVTGAASITTVTDRRAFMGGGYAAVANTIDNFMQNQQTTAGLTFGYYGGNARWGNVSTAVANGTVVLSASTTNYVELDLPSASVSTNTVGFTDGRVPLFQIVTGAASITTVTDKRSFIGAFSVPMQAIVNPYAYDPTTTAALNFGYKAGQVRNDNTVSTVAASTIALTASTTNYVEANPATGAVTKNVVGFTSGLIALYQIVTGAASITTITDKRALLTEPVTLSTVNAAMGIASTSSAVGCDIPIGSIGKPNGNDKLLVFVPARPCTLPINLTGSTGYAEAVATAAATITLYKNGSSIGTINFALGANTPTFTFSAAVSFNGTTDRLTVQYQASADATLGDFGVTLKGVLT